MKKYTVEKRKIPSTGRDIKILVFRPTTARKVPAQTPGVLWIHGGGYATGMAEMAYFSRPLALVKSTAQWWCALATACPLKRLIPQHWRTAILHSAG